MVRVKKMVVATRKTRAWAATPYPLLLSFILRCFSCGSTVLSCSPKKVPKEGCPSERSLGNSFAHLLSSNSSGLTLRRTVDDILKEFAHFVLEQLAFKGESET